jgi:hypothetical protein
MVGPPTKRPKCRGAEMRSRSAKSTNGGQGSRGAGRTEGLQRSNPSECEQGENDPRLLTSRRRVAIAHLASNREVSTVVDAERGRAGSALEVDAELAEGLVLVHLRDHVGADVGERNRVEAASKAVVRRRRTGPNREVVVCEPPVLNASSASEPADEGQVVPWPRGARNIGAVAAKSEDRVKHRGRGEVVDVVRLVPVSNEHLSVNGSRDRRSARGTYGCAPR